MYVYILFEVPHQFTFVLMMDFKVSDTLPYIDSPQSHHDLLEVNSLSHWAASMIQNDKMISTFLLVMPSFAIFSDCIQDCRASWERPWNVVFYKKLN